MSGKKFFAGLLSLSLVFTGCGGSSEPEIIMPDETVKTAVGNNGGTGGSGNGGNAAKSSGDTYKIWLVTMDQQDQYWLNINNGCKKAADEIGNVEYTWNSPDVNDDEKQKQCINDAVEAGVSAIIVAANGPANVNDALQNAKDAGIKIVFVDSPADFDCVQKLATDNEAAGRTAGEKMLDDLKASNITKGNIGIIGVTKDTASCIAREKGFRSAFDGTGFTLLDTFYMGTDVQAAKKAVDGFIDKKCVGIFGANEGATSATGSRIKETGDNVEIIGFDTSDTVLGYISEGIISATMAQNPDTMGYEGMKTAVKALNGEDTGEESIDTGVSVITSDDM